LTERFVRSDPPTEAELGVVREFVQGVFREKLSEFVSDGIERAVGVGGTVTAFGALDLNLSKYDPTRIENHLLSRDRIAAIEKQLCSIPLANRRDLAGVSRGRADIIPAGAVILTEFVNRFPISGVTVSTRGLRYGLVLSEARKLKKRSTQAAS